jgi:Xaa-Pro aminopeptidase
MPQAEFEQRVARLKAAMEAEKIDLLITYGTAFNESGETSYLTNFMVRLPQGTIVIVPRQGPIVLIFEGGSRNLLSVHDVTWVADVRASADCAKEAVKYLKEKKLIPSRVGLAKVRDRMPHQQYRLLMEGLQGSTIMASDHLLDSQRVMKSAREIDEMRRCGLIVKAGLGFLASAHFRSMNEGQIDALLRRQARLDGAEDVRILLGKPGAKNWSLRPAEDSDLSEGERCIVYVACAFERYWTEAARTFTVNRSSFTESDVGEVVSLYEKARAALKPGTTTAALYKEIMDSASGSGLDMITDYGFGGSIGQSLDEWPFFTLKEGVDLKQGMAFSLRLMTKHKGQGASMIGNTLLVGPDGGEALTA